ncbi:MAG: hypothetical protein IJM37_11865 [Lachnospiraceae bacterium]|nr:hypothetical protein [Lachnospiraceae bacterium]
MQKNYSPLEIYCSTCGAPARFDIEKQTYLCAHCGAKTGIGEPLAEKQGFRRLHTERMKEEKRNYPLVSCACKSCGATIVFEKNEALTDCAFCGHSLVRQEYISVEDFPEILIPFKITQDEAKERLLDWCQKHGGRREAKDIKKHIDKISGCYLPFELVKGPVDCKTGREDGTRKYNCRGFVEGSFINTSKQLNNLLLNGTEPYDLNELKEFEFSYLAGQRVKIRDINDADAANRIRGEIAADYEPFIARTMETHAVNITPDVSNMLEMSAVLPAYYLRAGDTLAAVNGQTGKTAVREAKDRFLLPWWLRPIGWTAVVCALIFGIMKLFGADNMMCAYICGIMAVFLLMVLFTAYHDKYEGDKRWMLARRIFSSDKERMPVSKPEFYEVIDGNPRTVKLRFTTVLRVLKMLCIAFGVVFLPLIIAFLLNGFSTSGLTIGGAAVWLCITVPIAPVYLLKFGRLDLYEHPLIWIKNQAGRFVRYRGRKGKSLKERLAGIKNLLNPAVFIGAAVVLGLLFINVLLVLHWDDFG